MNLTFLGRGSAFNTKEGNTSAYFISSNGSLLLIDCGETVFAKILSSNLLDDVKKVFVAITHMHSDHVGSLVSLAMYCYYIKKMKINIVLTKDERQNNMLSSFMRNMGVLDESVNYMADSDLANAFPELDNFEYVLTPHVQQINSYGIVMITTNGLIYYSGDTNSTEHVEKYITYPNLDKIYIDTCKEDFIGNVHLSVKKLCSAIKPESRNKIYCMHIDDSNYIPSLISMGFNVVDVK